MKYTDWIVPKLRELEEKRAALTSIPEQIRTLELSADALRASRVDGERISGGEENPRESAILAVIAERDELSANFEITRREVETLDRALAELDQDERTALDRFYIHRRKNAAEDLCAELGYEIAQVYRIKNRALVKLAHRMFGQAKATPPTRRRKCSAGLSAPYALRNA